MPEQDRDRPPAFEDCPLTRQEYISAMVHFYRGQMQAMVAALVAAWRTGLPIDEVKGLERDLEHWKV